LPEFSGKTCSTEITIAVDLAKDRLTASSSLSGQEQIQCSFQLNPFDKELVAAGGWLAYADHNF
jgi:3-isopropylmalate/(R)-2-methylmalate dehydratase small subunit